MAKKILLVDDEPDILKVTAFRLEKNGYEVFTVLNGKEALGLLKKKTPNLIFLDLILPQMSGHELCKRIKMEDRLKDIPIILFTASATHVREKVRALGANGFLLKPFSPEELLSKVKEFLG